MDEFQVSAAKPRVRIDTWLVFPGSWLQDLDV